MHIVSILAGVVLGLSCIYVNHFTSLAVLLLIYGYLNKSEKISTTDMHIVGTSFHITSMWWLWPTMEKFGGMHASIAFCLMILHSILSAFQFSLFHYVISRLNNKIFIDIRALIVWILFDLYFPRMFPWSIGNFFINWTFLSSYAELFGVVGVSAIIIFCLSIFRALILTNNVYIRLSNVFILTAVIFIGYRLDINALSEIDQGINKRVLVVQGNLGIEKKGKSEYLEANLEKYRELSSKFSENDYDLIVWPESVVGTWLDQSIERYDFRAPDPFINAKKPLLYGGLSYKRSNSDISIYNSAMLRQVDGSVSAPYSKKILMPFGEYVPGAKTFPVIRNFTPIERDFSVGESDMPIEINQNEPASSMQLGVSICYEDLSTSQSTKLVNNKANLFINLTNDAWYGDSPAPYQHDLLARYRAIENRRFMLRSTNTGYTTLSNSRGEILRDLPIFKEASEVWDVILLNRTTLYSLHGNIVLMLMIPTLVFLILIGRIRR